MHREIGGPLTWKTQFNSPTKASLFDNYVITQTGPREDAKTIPIKGVKFTANGNNIVMCHAVAPSAQLDCDSKFNVEFVSPDQVKLGICLEEDPVRKYITIKPTKGEPKLQTFDL